MMKRNQFSYINPYNIQMEDENRRRVLLNIFLFGISIIATIILVIAIIFRNKEIEGTTFMFYVVPVVLIFCFSIYLIGRKHVFLASSLFIVMMLVAVTFSDLPEQVLEGRSLFFMLAPIMIASFIIGPIYSYYAAILGSILLSGLAYFSDLPMNYIGAVGFFLFAFVSWLASTIYENTLEELKTINARLDERVEARTSELAKANERLKDLDRLKTMFVSNVSHELRTPITNIAMYLEMLEVGNPDNHSLYMQILKDETDRLTSLVSDTLDLSRLELGVIKMTISEINVNDICEHVVNANLLQAESKNLYLVMAPGENVSRIWGDSEKITQVVQNLVSNAINYTPFGNITVSTEEIEKKGQKFACIRIKDTGIGIDDEDLDQLFQPFYRGTKMNQSSIPGSGLGLAISKEIIGQHQGEISIDTIPGEGSTFSILLPITPSPQVFAMGIAPEETDSD